MSNLKLAESSLRGSWDGVKFTVGVLIGGIYAGIIGAELGGLEGAAKVEYLLEARNTTYAITAASAAVAFILFIIGAGTNAHGEEHHHK